MLELNEAEKIFFTELCQVQSNPNGFSIKRMSNGALEVTYNSYYVGKIKLTGRKHWMQILRGLTQQKCIYGELDDFIQHIPDWTKYIKNHCK